MLTTKRLTLRRARVSDLDDFHAIMRDPKAMAYWSTPPHRDMATTKRQLDGMIAREDPQTYLIFEHQSRMIGMSGMHSGNEIGFMLTPAYWRQGFVSEAMEVLIPYLWAVTDIDHLFADADPRNIASVGLLRSLGFSQSDAAKNTYRVGGTWSDSVYFRLNRPS